MKWTKGKIASAIGSALLAGVVITVVVQAASIPDRTTHRHDLESTLTHVYADGANYLSSCETNAQAAVGLAQQNAAAFNKVIDSAIAKSGTAGQYNLQTSTGRAGFFPLLVQAYPDLKGQTALFDKAVDIIVGCQRDFRDKQSAVQDRLRDFDRWRGNFWVGLFHQAAPDDFLYVNLQGLELSGWDAYHKIGKPLVTGDTAGAYQQGTYEPSMFGVTPSSSPAALPATTNKRSLELAV